MYSSRLIVCNIRLPWLESLRIHFDLLLISAWSNGCCLLDLIFVSFFPEFNHTSTEENRQCQCKRRAATTVGGIDSAEAYYWQALVWNALCALRDLFLLLRNGHMLFNETVTKWIISMAELYKRGRPLRCQFYCDISSKFLIRLVHSALTLASGYETKQSQTPIVDRCRPLANAIK